MYLKSAMTIAVMNAIAFITAMIIAYLISNPQFNIWNISCITSQYVSQLYNMYLLVCFYMVSGTLADSPDDILLSLYCLLRNERAHPNFVSKVREIESFCEDCKLAAPLGFLRGLGPRFRVHRFRSARAAQNVWPWFSSCFSSHNPFCHYHTTCPVERTS